MYFQSPQRSSAPRAKWNNPQRFKHATNTGMKELALHILDIVQNSIVANASLIEVVVDANTNTDADTLIISVIDNGKGIPADMLEKITDPYITSRTTRRVGMGIPLLKDACELTGGSLSISSEVGNGTHLQAILKFSHIDRQPLGDITGVIMLLINANPQIDFIYRHSLNGNEYVFDTREVKEALDGIAINEPEVYRMLKEMISLNLDEIQIA